MFDNIFVIGNALKKQILVKANFGHFCIQRASLHWRICRQTWQAWLTCLYLQSLLSNVLDMDDDFRSTTLPTVTAPVHHPSHVAGHQNAGFVRWVGCGISCHVMSCHVMSCHVLCVMLLLLMHVTCYLCHVTSFLCVMLTASRHVLCVKSLLNMCHVNCVTSCLMCQVTS